MNKTKILNTHHIFKLILCLLLPASSIVSCAEKQRDYKVKNSGLVVDDAGLLIYSNFYWLDNHRIITQTRGKIIDKPTIATYPNSSLVEWDIDTNQIKTLVTPSAADFNVVKLCVSDEIVRYSTIKRVDEKTYNAQGGHITKASVSRLNANKEVGVFKEVTYVSPIDIDFMSCLTNDVARARLPEWAKQVPRVNIKFLKPKHGFIYLDRNTKNGSPTFDEKGKPFGWPRAVIFYKPDESQAHGIDVTAILRPESTGNLFPLLPERFYLFKNAYHIEYLKESVKPIWFTPEGKVIEEPGFIEFRNPNIKSLNHDWMYPTKELSPISGVVANNDKKVWHSGLYSYQEINKPRLLVSGRIGQTIQISPNGCLAAFLNDDRKYIEPRHLMRFYKLQVINLCEKSS